MYLQILLTCGFTTLLVHGQTFPKSTEIQPRLGYSSNVVHTYPENNDLHSESSVRVNFQPQQGVPVQSSPTRGGIKYLQASSNAPSFYTRPIYDNPKNTNSFNVGYNISFSNTDGAKTRKPIYTRANNKKLENAEVITGKSKKNEKVRAPSTSGDLSPQDFVSHAFLKQKQILLENLRHTSSPLITQGSKNSVKYLNPIREYASKFSSQSPKFTYNTQQNIFRDVIKATKPDPIQLGQDFKTSYQTSSRWKNVSPGLEISKSIEPQIAEHNNGNYNSRYTNSKAPHSEQPRTFNHDSALKNSESFDFSNAHGEILYGENDSANDNFSEGSEQYAQEYYSENTLNNQQFSDLNNINIEAHIPARLKGIKPLPLDTSLLKDAVLTTDFREAPKDPRVIPIRFDIRNIETVMKDQSAQIQNYAAKQNAYSSAQFSNPSQVPGLNYEDHDQSASQKDFRIYGKPESVGTNQYRMGYNHDRQHLNFGNDVYKIVSMRPPPVG